MKKEIDIISINDDMEAMALRSVLEYWGIKNRLHFIDKPQDLVDLLDGSIELYKDVILMCHGTEEGIVLPELATEVANSQPFNKKMTPEDLRRFLKLKNQNIINTGCNTGIFSDVFFHAGAGKYIAPSDYPEGSASILFIVNFYYFNFVKKVSFDESYSKASTIDAETQIFKSY